MHDIDGQLVATGALAQRIPIDVLEVALRSVPHGSRRIVQRSGHHADEGHFHIVLHHVFLDLAPFHLLHTEYALEVDDVRIGTVQAGRFVDSVEVERELVARTGFGNPIDHLDTRLVVPIQEIDLESADAHGCIFGAGLFQLFIQHIENGPQHQLYIFRFAVADQFGQIHLRNDGQHIARLGVVPALIQHDKGNMVLGSEIDIVLIGGCVDACFEINSGNAPVVPPVPCDLACLDPTVVTNPVGSRQRIDQRIDRHLGIICCDSHDTPGEGALTGCLGDEVGTSLHLTHVAGRVVLHTRRVGRKFTFDRLGCPFGADEHARIALQIRFGQGQFDPLSVIDGDGQEGRLLLGLLAQGRLFIQILKGHGIGVATRTGGRIGHVALVVLVETEGGCFVPDEERILRAGFETIGNPFVVGPEYQGKRLLEFQGQLVVSNRNGGGAVEG